MPTSRQFRLVPLVLVLLTGCSGQKSGEPATGMPPTPTKVPHPRMEALTAKEVDSETRIMIPESDLGVPMWVGRRSDEPFDIQAYLKERRGKYVPDVEQGYLLAMSRFSPDIASFLPEPLRDQQMPRARAILDQLVELVPSDEPGDEPWDESKAREVFSQVKETIREIDSLQQRAECIFSVSYKHNQVLPHLQAARSLARIGVLEARLLNPKTEFDAIKRSLNRSFRLSRDVSRHGSLLPFLVGHVIDRAALGVVQEFLVRWPILSADQCEELAELLRGQVVDEVKHLTHCARSEYILCANSLWGLEQGTLTAEDIDLRTLEPQVAKAINYETEWIALNEMFRFVLQDYIVTPYHKVLKHDAFAEKVGLRREMAEKSRMATFRKTEKLPGGSIAVFLAPAFGQFREAVARNEFRLKATRALLLVRRFELVHGRLPLGLNEAFNDVKAGQVPMDPYLESELKFRVVGGSVKVYSVGKDQQDDGAEQDWNYGQQRGDFILSMPVVKP